VEFFSALKPDVLRTVTTNVVPGFVGVAPWVGGVFWPVLQQGSFWSQDGVLVPVAITLATIVLVAGLVFEDLGSRVEVFWADRWIQRDRPEFQRDWAEFLSSRRDEQVIAYGYLRAILNRFKFSLSMVPAVASCFAGVLVAELMDTGFGVWRSMLLLAGLLALWLVLLCEVRSGARLLADARKILIEALKKPPT